MSEVLKCDAAGCGHVEQVMHITAEHVGMPCPKCGSNLLTRQDWEAWRPIQALMLAASSLDSAGSGEKIELNVRVHGEKTSIEITKPKPT
ncbi:zinc ribbon domain-containing protein [Phaeobacter sp. S60]|uniref:FmdB family zinc ribbon protein n=1 Tax=Phaeobacter sp. S60 TaxID=1569353 RepID=UPI0006935F54|nr:zinc ribbon domain-containing protein [Phaeobacter sp. S60]